MEKSVWVHGDRGASPRVFGDSERAGAGGTGGSRRSSTGFADDTARKRKRERERERERERGGARRGPGMADRLGNATFT